mmetsp:Transcript_38552/g.95496  ORF Transcript_38552/g.95496 Transcript_38552/m.95496 type:complete len:451 (-) Transcript_38552:707-2059(-)
MLLRRSLLRWSASAVLLCLLVTWTVLIISLTAQFSAEPDSVPRRAGDIFNRVMRARAATAPLATSVVEMGGSGEDEITSSGGGDSGGGGGGDGERGGLDADGPAVGGGGGERARSDAHNEGKGGTNGGVLVTTAAQPGVPAVTAAAEAEGEGEEKDGEEELPAQEELVTTEAESNSGMQLGEWLAAPELRKTIMAITTFFNPGRHLNKVANFRAFRQHLMDQGLLLVTVELIFRDAEGEIDADGRLIDFQLTAEDSDILIKRSTARGNTLWQKERLMNIALAALPKECTKVVWLDSDLYFVNRNWVPRTAEILDKFPVVQPFAWLTYLPSDEDPLSYIPRLGDLPLGMGVGKIYHSAGLAMRHFQPYVFKSSFILGHPGFAWAMRRNTLEAAGGFYEARKRMGLKAHAFGRPVEHILHAGSSPAHLASVIEAFETGEVSECIADATGSHT